MLIILMIGFLEPVDLTNNGREYQILEFYAGAARLAKTGHHFGGSVAAMDRLYDTVGDNKAKNNAMDFNTSGGFVYLPADIVRFCWLCSFFWNGISTVLQHHRIYLYR